MRKFMSVFILAGIMFSSITAVSYAADFKNQDSIVDKAGDWMATIGKSPEEKDQIIAQRKTDRVAKRIAEAMREGGRQAGKEMEKLGQAMQKN